MLDPIRAGDSLTLRKQRGAFFTPPEVARFLADAVIEDGARSVLDPSCGEAAFLIAAAQSAEAHGVEVGIHGVEIFAESARFAETALHGLGHQASIEVADFFEEHPTRPVDAVIGNPPYVRFHEHSGAARERSLSAARLSGVKLSELASIWAAFVVHATWFLNKGGSLGLVLPAELLSVNYAAPVRRLLAQSFTEVTLYLFDERIFPTAQEDVVLLHARGYGEGSTGSLVLRQVQDADSLRAPSRETRWSPLDASQKWTPSLVAEEAVAVTQSLVEREDVGPLSEWGKVSLGAVTGANGYFALTAARVAELGLSARDLHRLSPPGSSHLRQLVLDDAAMRRLDATGQRTWLFSPHDEPSDAARAYIATGEAAGIDQAYKCRVRSPWWRVPLAQGADLFLTYMNADTPRLASNDAQVAHLNSVHGVRLRPELAALGRRLLPIASLTSMTRLDAEVVGRAYGGGMLKIEPGEARRLLLPSPALVERLAPALDAISGDVRRLILDDDLDAAVEMVDALVLVQGLGLSAQEAMILREGRDRLAARRANRSRKRHPATRGEL